MLLLSPERSQTYWFQPGVGVTLLAALRRGRQLIGKSRQMLLLFWPRRPGDGYLLVPRCAGSTTANQRLIFTAFSQEDVTSAVGLSYITISML